MFKVGDIVKLNLESILKYTIDKPIWYVKDGFEILKVTDYDTIFLNEFGGVEKNKTDSDFNEIHVEFVELDIKAMRRKKLERLYNEKV